MNQQDYSYELSTQETDRQKPGDIENKSKCPFPSNGLPMPKGHEGYSESDKEKCPVMSGMIKAPAHDPANPETLDQSTTKKKKEKKKPKGGCPFMASDNKKPPALEFYPAAYEVPYVSAMRYLIKYKESSNKNTTVPLEKRWENLPVFLKHTLFHDEEKLDKIRKLEMGQRFFLYDKFREQANKSCNKGRYHEAIGLYEHALSCIKWLKYKDVQKQKPVKDGKKEEGSLSTQTTLTTEEKSHLEEEKEIKTDKTDLLNTAEKSQSESNAEDDDDEDVFEGFEEEEKEEEDHDPYKDLKPINKLLLKPITDENIEVYDGEDLEDDTDKDMRTAMLASVYHGLAVCYMRLNHYTVALQAIEEGLKVNEKSSQLHYRRAQIRAFNKGSTLKDLLLAKQDIEKAIELKPHEKIFKNDPGMLKMLNIHNADEAYKEQALYIDALIKERRNENNENIKAIMTKVREIEFLENAFRKEGKKVPFAADQNHAVDIKNNDDDQMEWEVTNEMLKKYNKLIEFYQETERKDQVDLAKKEIQTVLEVAAKMQFYRELDFNNWEKNDEIKEQMNDIKLDMSSKSVQDRLRRFKNERSRELFENGNFNVEVYQYALRDYLKRKEELDQKAKKGKSGHDELEPKKSRLQSIFSLDFNYMQVVAFVLIVGLLWFLNKKNLIPAGLVWSDGQSKGSF